MPAAAWARPPSPPGRGQVLEHALPVVDEHPVQGDGHGVSPEEVKVHCIISIKPLSRVEGEQLINNITGKSILYLTSAESAPHN